jgi:hypothetical protein
MFFFRSALFSESFFGGKAVIFCARILAMLGVGSLVVIVAGIIKQIRAKDTLLIPLLVILIIVLEGAIAYRVLHPSAPNQDFRFSILILPAITYFAVRASEGTSTFAMLYRVWLFAFTVAVISFFIAAVIQYF